MKIIMIGSTEYGLVIKVRENTREGSTVSILTDRVLESFGECMEDLEGKILELGKRKAAVEFEGITIECFEYYRSMYRESTTRPFS